MVVETLKSDVVEGSGNTVLVVDFLRLDVGRDYGMCSEVGDSWNVHGGWGSWVGFVREVCVGESLGRVYGAQDFSSGYAEGIGAAS